MFLGMHSVSEAACEPTETENTQLQHWLKDWRNRYTTKGIVYSDAF